MYEDGFLESEKYGKKNARVVAARLNQMYTRTLKLVELGSAGSE